MSSKKIKIILFILLFFVIVFPALAKKPLDTDKDGISDEDELTIYHTSIYEKDTDGDGFSDWVELNTGFSPLDPKSTKLEDADYDNDGLSDRMELNFHTDLTDANTDNDGFKDGEEINAGYDPLNAKKGALLEKRIEINTNLQELNYFLGGVRMGKCIISTGKPSMPTPKGNFKIDGKNPRAWSATYGLWMPYWMSLYKGKFGIHELPEWPGGRKEGEAHLGTPISHGCVRLGVGNAEFLYNWTPVGTSVFIY